MSEGNNINIISLLSIFYVVKTFTCKHYWLIVYDNVVFVLGTTINLDGLHEETLQEHSIGEIFYIVTDPDVGDVPQSFIEVEEGPSSIVEEAPKVPISVKEGNEQSKKRKVTSQDIQVAQLDVLMLEKQKTIFEIQNMQLLKEKIKLEVAEMKSKASSSVNLK